MLNGLKEPSLRAIQSYGRAVAAAKKGSCAAALLYFDFGGSMGRMGRGAGPFPRKKSLRSARERAFEALKKWCFK